MAAELADGTRFIGDLAEIFPRSRVPALRHCDRDPLIVNIQANMTTFECWSIKRWNLDLRADRADRQKAFGKGQRQVYAPRAGALAAAEQPGQNLAGIDERRVDAQLAKGLVKPGETGVEFAVHSVLAVEIEAALGIKDYMTARQPPGREIDMSVRRAPIFEKVPERFRPA
jgi:hypothetical protein